MRRRRSLRSQSYALFTFSPSRYPLTSESIHGVPMYNLFSIYDPHRNILSRSDVIAENNLYNMNIWYVVRSYYDRYLTVYDVRFYFNLQSENVQHIFYLPSFQVCTTIKWRFLSDLYAVPPYIIILIVLSYILYICINTGLFECMRKGD